MRRVRVSLNIETRKELLTYLSKFVFVEMATMNQGMLKEMPGELRNEQCEE
jgi:hypothetical protein